MTDSLSSFSRKYVLRTYPSLNSHSLPGSLSSKSDVLWKKQLVLLAAQTTTQMLSLEPTTVFWYAAQVLYLYFPVHQTILKKTRDFLKLVTSTASSREYILKWNWCYFYFTCIVVKIMMNIDSDLVPLLWFMLRGQQFYPPLSPLQCQYSKKSK